MQHPEKTPLHILLISVHGLIRGHDLELGRDADTGGQTKYVIELARALGENPQTSRIDLMTRVLQTLRSVSITVDHLKP
jgi:sucrose-phosphate synthase